MITITVQRHRITGRMFGENIIESKVEKQETYTRQKIDMGVADRSALKNEFIEQIAKEVTSQNRAEENRFKKKKSGTFLRLVIININ